MRNPSIHSTWFVSAILWFMLIDLPVSAARQPPAAPKEPSSAYGLVSQRDSQEIPAVVQAWRQEILRLYNEGKYSEAIELQKRELAWTEKTLGSEHLVTAHSLNNLAWFYHQQGRYGEAESSYVRALEIREQALGPEHPTTAESLDRLASLYFVQHRYGKAELLYQRVLAIMEKAFGPDHPNTAQGLNNLARTYTSQGRYGEAEPLYRRALEIRDKAFGPVHPSTNDSLHRLAVLYVSQGRYREAEPLLQRALFHREQAFGQDHPNTAQSLNILAILYDRMGRYHEADPLYQRALAIKEKARGSDDPYTDLAFTELEIHYATIGRTDGMESLYQRALEIVEKAFGSDHINTAQSLNSLAILYAKQRRYGEAEPLFRQALSITEKVFGPNHPNTTWSLTNLAHLYISQGRSDKAEPLYQRVLAITEKAFGTDFFNITWMLENLALLYVDQGRYREAENLLQRALEIMEKAFGPVHQNTAQHLTYLGMLYDRQGRHDEAELLYQRTLAINTALGPEHPDTAQSLFRLASLYDQRGRYNEADPLYQRALAIREKALGPEHPDTAQSLNSLGVLRLNQKRYGAAEQLLRRGIAIQSRFLQKQLPLLPVEQRQGVVRLLDRAWEVTFSAAPFSARAAHLALFSRLNHQGLLLETERRQGVLLRGSAHHREYAMRLGLLTTRLSDPALPAPERQALEQERQQLQYYLYAELPAMQPRILQPAQVAQALPEGATFVAFQRYQPFDGRRPPGQRWTDPHYLALILSKDGTTSAVDLGPATGIEPLIKEALSLCGTPGTPPREIRAAWQKVHEKVFPHSLLNQLRESRLWVLSPDGELSRIPFLAVPSPLDASRPLPESVAVQVVTSGRDLVPDPNRPSRQQVGLPLVLADPDFGDGGPWSRLKASQKEGRTIAGMFNVPPHLGPQASEATIKDAANAAPTVLHVASHGFFALEETLADPQPASPPADLRTALSRPFWELPPRREDAMLNSAIILAGANRSTDNGYLYAKEVAQLQLDGTDLVVLSACETAAGVHRSGEGLYGLQRALRVAGARSTLLSLWKVDDAATATFMERYYDKLLNQNMGKLEALLAVQKEFRSGQHNPAWKDWAYWGAWQLVGDTGLLQR